MVYGSFALGLVELVLAVVLVPTLGTASEPETGANGSRRPMVSGDIGVVISTSTLKRGSEKILVSNEIGVSSLTSA